MACFAFQQDYENNNLRLQSNIMERKEKNDSAGSEVTEDAAIVYSMYQAEQVATVAQTALLLDDAISSDDNGFSAMALALALQADEDYLIKQQHHQPEKTLTCIQPHLDDLETDSDRKPSAIPTDECASTAVEKDESAHKLKYNEKDCEGAIAKNADARIASQEQHVVDCDEALALALARDQEDVVNSASSASFTTKAWNFVQTVLEEHSKLQGHMASSNNNAVSLELVGIDDMLVLVERLAEAQAVFGFDQKMTHVDIGYHYTRGDNLHNIRSNGLLTRTERRAKGVDNNYNGSAWGDGVYTANNPHAFRNGNFGDTGLIVARLQGDRRPAVLHGRSFVGDTAIANAGMQNEMVILGQSYQCVPLVQFQNSIFRDGNAVSAIWAYHGKLQQIVDTFFNDGAQTQVLGGPPPADWSRLSSPGYTVPRTHAATLTPLSSSTSMPLVQSKSSWYQTWRQQNPIGQCTKPERPRALQHSPYLSESYQRHSSDRSEKCNCSTEKMRILHFSKDKLACDTADTIVIVYAFMSTENSNNLTHRIAYLPETPESQVILERLKFAFCSGITSPTTWPLIPHRTNPYLHYFNYESICARALDGLGVPKVDKCDSSANLLLRKKGSKILAASI